MELNPQQELFLIYYLDPKSDTFGDTGSSGIKAGFGEAYARTLTSQPRIDWVDEGIKEYKKGKFSKMLAKAENNLDEFLQDKDKKIKSDITKFVAERIGKEDWSTKTEVQQSGEVTIKVEELKKTLKNWINDETTEDNEAIESVSVGNTDSGQDVDRGTN